MKTPESTKTTHILLLHYKTQTQVHEDTWLCRVGGVDQSNVVKRTPRDTQLHINRGSPYQKQRDLSSQPTSSGPGRGEKGLQKKYVTWAERYSKIIHYCNYNLSPLTLSFSRRREEKKRRRAEIKQRC